MMHKEEMIIGGLTINIIRKANLKNLYIRVVPPEGKITVSAPRDLSDEDIKLFALKKLPEIVTVRDRMLTQERQSKREYVSGEAHYLWGKPYRLQVIYEGEQYNIVRTPTKIILTVPESATRESKEKVFIEWYRKELKRVLQSVVQRCEKKIGVHASEFRIRNMKTKWGTCNIDKSRIWINLQLAKKPVECLEYVVTHELVHLLERNHTHRFQACIEKFYPTWKEAKKLLNMMPLDYIGKGEEDIDDKEIDIE